MGSFIHHIAKAFDLLGVTRYRINNAFSIIGKFGFAQVSETLSADNDGKGKPIDSYNYISTFPELSLGAALNVTQNINVNVSINRIFAENLPSSLDSIPGFQQIPTLDFYAIGLNYQF